MANLREIAEEAGVSVATASIILNAPEKAGRFKADTVRRVRRIAQARGYARNASRRGSAAPARSPSLRDVAQAAGVSIATASMVLNSPDKASQFKADRIDHVRQAAARLGYQRNIHATRFRTRKSQAIGLVLEFLTAKHVRDLPYWAWILSGLDYGARTHGYEVIIVGPHEKESAMAHAIDKYHQCRLDGLVLPGQPSAAATRCLRNYSGPSILTARPRSTDTDAVFEDDGKGIGDVVEHLHALGHRRVAWLTPAHWPGGTSTYRTKIFLREAHARGMRVSVQHLPTSPEIQSAEDLIHAAQTAARALLSQRRIPTAVACFNDDCALGVYHAAHDLGLAIPGVVSVTGYDDRHGLYFHPGLTTVHSCILPVGQQAATRLIERIEQQPADQSRRPLREALAPHLVVRQSTGPC